MIGRELNAEVFVGNPSLREGLHFLRMTRVPDTLREFCMSHVLIVEDEAHLAKGLQFNLEAEGHSVAVVGDGERALDLLLGQSGEPAEFDAVVLDVMLPGKDGFTVATELRAAKQYVPVLMLTARGRPEDVLKGFASGADDYLPKPFELPILLARLQGLLRRREWMRQSPAAKAASSRGVRVILVPRPDHRFRKAGIAGERKHHPVDADGGGTAPPSHPESGTDRLPQIDSRRSVGSARGHRHPRHR